MSHDSTLALPTKDWGLLALTWCGMTGLEAAENEPEQSQANESIQHQRMPFSFIFIHSRHFCRLARFELAMTVRSKVSGRLWSLCQDRLEDLSSKLFPFELRKSPLHLSMMVRTAPLETLNHGNPMQSVLNLTHLNTTLFLNHNY
jgi:hypothetical protein